MSAHAQGWLAGAVVSGAFTADRGTPAQDFCGREQKNELKSVLEDMQVR